MALSWLPPDQGSVGPNLDNHAAHRGSSHGPPANGVFKMDRYTVTPYEGLASITVFPPSVDPNLQFLGQHYALAEANFQPEIALRRPNILAALAGTSDGWYSNSEPPASDKFHRIFDQLQAAGRSWDIFFGFPPAYLQGTYWDSLVPAGHTNQLVTTGQFIADAAVGTLPDFSFVRPGVGYSEESPEDTSLGDAWLGQLVLAVMKGPDWPTTAIFVTYDEGGGFWDHVSPPQVDSDRLWHAHTDGGDLAVHARQNSSVRRRPTSRSCRLCRRCGICRHWTPPTCWRRTC